MPPISIDIAPCLRLVNNEITLSAAVSLARRYARDGCWEVERLERQPLAALLAYACNLTALGADGCAEVIYKTAGLIGRDDEEVRAALRALPLRAAVTKDEIQLAYRLLRKGVPGLQLATAVRRAKLGLGEELGRASSSWTDWFTPYRGVKMKKIDYSKMTNDELVKRFETACLEQYDTYITDNFKQFSVNYKILVRIIDKLTARGPQARRSLLPLLSNDNRQVRLQAAKFVYPVAREEAKKCLQDLAAARFPDDQSLSAGMCLYRLEEVPDCLDH